jgi:hypothetical protein
MSLKEWVRDNFDDLELLEASTFQYRPGVILNPQGSAEIRTAAWALLKEPVTDPFWATRRGPALLPQRSFQEERDAGGTIKIPGLLAVTLKDQGKVAAAFTAEEVEVELFTNAFESDIELKLRERFHGTPLWVQFIDDHRIVMECWYLRHLRVTFTAEGARLAQAEAQQRLDISAAGATTWKENDVLEIQGAAIAPFAVRTFRP